jgi:hypothetical protein
MSFLHTPHRRTSEQLAFTIESEETLADRLAEHGRVQRAIRTIELSSHTQSAASAIDTIQSAIHIIGRRSVAAPHELAPKPRLEGRPD